MGMLLQCKQLARSSQALSCLAGVLKHNLVAPARSFNTKTQACNAADAQKQAAAGLNQPFAASFGHSSSISTTLQQHQSGQAAQGQQHLQHVQQMLLSMQQQQQQSGKAQQFQQQQQQFSSSARRDGLHPTSASESRALPSVPSSSSSSSSGGGSSSSSSSSSDAWLLSSSYCSVLHPFGWHANSSRALPAAPCAAPTSHYKQLHHSSSSSSSSATAAIRAFSTAASSSSSSSATGASWVDRYLPHQLAPYAHLMRLDKPIGSWLLAWPGLWSIALAADPGHLPDLWLTTLFGVGAVMMRGAGCTINDLWDKDIDKQVERTRTRPLAAATISTPAALVFLAVQLSLSLGILLQLNPYTQVLGVCSLALVGTYPLMKRVTWWPQAFLGLAMNYGVLMGYSAAAGSCDWAVVLPMYVAGVNWTLVYDTIYAHQDKKDDALVGVKSTALLFGDGTKRWACGFAALQSLGLVLAGQAAGCGVPFYAAVAAGAGHQAWQIGSVDLNNGPDCMAKFVSNKWYGALIYAGIVADKLLV